MGIIGSFAGKLRLRKTITSSKVLAKVEELGKGWPSPDASDLYPSFRISDGQHSIMAYKVGNVSLEAAKSALENGNLIQIHDWRILPEDMVKKDKSVVGKTKYCLVIRGQIEEIRPYPVLDVNESLNFGNVVSAHQAAAASQRQVVKDDLTNVVCTGKWNYENGVTLLAESPAGLPPPPFYPNQVPPYMNRKRKQSY